jgi:hypothetical protein
MRLLAGRHAAAIDELVLLHAPCWGDPTLLDIEWLNCLSGT